MELVGKSKLRKDAARHGDTERAIEVWIRVVEEAEWNNLMQVLKKDRILEETAVLKLMAALIKEFDEKDKKPDPASPHEILVHLMEENQVRQADLVGKIGSKGVISEIVNGKRSISKSQAKALGEIFQVSPAIFI